MNNTIRDTLLSDRLVLKNEISDTFVESMRLRLIEGIPKFGLSTCNIEPVYCSSVNKHTCIEIIDDDESVFYMMLDEHHLEVLGAMNLLFYIYGHDDLKGPLLNLMVTEIFHTPEKRLYWVASILLAERSLLDGNATKALAYIDKLKEYEITSRDFDGDAGEADLDWFLLKDRRAMAAQSMVMNYYVFHELAHIKAKYDPGTFSLYKKEVIEVMDLVQFMTYSESPFDKSKIPMEDVTCDVYALDILFDFMFNESGDYYYELVVESYIDAITNLTIMDSVVKHEIVEDWYIDCWSRIIISLNAVAARKTKKSGTIDFLKHVQSCMSYCHMKFRNYKKEIQRAFDDLNMAHGSIQEKYSVFSVEWIEEQRTALELLAALK